MERSHFLSKELQEDFKVKQPVINNVTLFQPKKERKVIPSESSLPPL